MRILRDNGLTLVLLLLFAASILGHALTGWRVETADALRHGQDGGTLMEYLGSAAFLSTVFENWESEFLQMAAYVVLTAFLLQKGSSESRDPEAPPRDADLEAQAGKAGAPAPLRWAPSHGLSIPGRWVWRLWSFSSPPSFSTGPKARARPRRRRWSMAKRPRGPSAISPTPSSGSSPSRTGRASSCPRRSWWFCRSTCGSANRLNPSRSPPPTTRPETRRTLPSERARARSPPPHPRRCCRR